MDFSAILQIIAILIECAVIVIALGLATTGDKGYGWLIAFTFALYVIFDLSRLNIIPVPDSAGAPLFLIASLSILLAVYLLLLEVKDAHRKTITREWL
jgi:hypothetical protein